VGGATRGKAIIILNPAEPPLIMRDTVYCLCEDGDRDGDPPSRSKTWSPKCRPMFPATG
jgi:acetaldehyde dehydrogenase (acetylating)